MHNGEISIQVQYTSWDQFRRQVEMEVYRYTQEKNNTDNSPFLGGINIADLPFKIKEIENRRVKYETITQENFLQNSLQLSHHLGSAFQDIFLLSFSVLFPQTEFHSHTNHKRKSLAPIEDLQLND